MKTLLSASLLQQENEDELNRLKDIFKDYGCTGTVTHEISGSNTLITAKYAYDDDTRENVKFGFELNFSSTAWTASSNKFMIYGSDGTTDTALWNGGQSTVFSSNPYLIIDSYKLAGGGFITRVNKGAANTSLQTTMTALAVITNGDKINYMYVPSASAGANYVKFNLDDGEGHILNDNTVYTADDPYHLIMGKIALVDGSMLNNKNVWGTIYAPSKLASIGMYSFEKSNEIYLGAKFKSGTFNYPARIIFKLATS